MKPFMTSTGDRADRALVFSKVARRRIQGHIGGGFIRWGQLNRSICHPSAFELAVKRRCWNGPPCPE